MLPTIAAEIAYAALEVKDGNSAQEGYAEAIAAGCTPERRLALDAALHAYCGRDTGAMIVLARRLQVHDDGRGGGGERNDDE